MCKKLMCLCRSLGKLSMGCCSTGLQTHLYGDFNFETTHGLWNISVVDETENDGMEPECRIWSKPQKKELLDQVSLICNDEFLNNNRHCFELPYDVFEGFPNKVFVGFGDNRQNPPIVRNGSPNDIMNAHIFTSPLFGRFRQFTFTQNLRLNGLHNNRDRKLILY